MNEKQSPNAKQEFAKKSPASGGLEICFHLATSLIENKIFDDFCLLFETKKLVMKHFILALSVMTQILGELIERKKTLNGKPVEQNHCTNY